MKEISRIVEVFEQVDFSQRKAALATVVWVEGSSPVRQLHREEKQLTGIAECQCRLNRSQRNYIVGVDTVAGIGLLSEYLRSQLIWPTIQFS